MTFTTQRSVMLGTSPGFPASQSAPVTRVRGARLTGPPKGKIEVDWSNPITRGMRFYGSPLLRPYGPILDTPAGPAFAYNSEPNKPWQTEAGLLPSGYPATDGVSMINYSCRRFNGDPFSPVFRIANNQNASGMNVGLASYGNLQGLVLSVALDNYGPTNQLYSPYPYLLPPTGDMVAIGGTYIRNTVAGQRLFCNGSFVNAMDTVDQGLFSNGDHAFFPGAGDATPTAMSAMWVRKLSDAEMIEMTLHPWQVFKYPDQLIWGKV